MVGFRYGGVGWSGLLARWREALSLAIGGMWWGGAEAGDLDVYPSREERLDVAGR